MITVNVREAKSQLSAWLEKVEQGEEVQIVRRGKPVAVLSAVNLPATIPSMRSFRESLEVSGATASESIEEMRDEARY